MPDTIPLRAILMVTLVTLTQIAGVTMLVKTTGFRDPLWTAACLATYAVSLFLLAETLRQGMALSLIMPILAAAVPLASIIIAVSVFREQASWMKLGLLSLSCVLIGVSAAV